MLHVPIMNSVPPIHGGVPCWSHLVFLHGHRMDHHNDTSKGNPSGPTSARQMNVYSGEWMTLPTLTAPMSDGGAAISNEDVVQEVHAIDIGIDDIARNKRLETMRSTIATTRRPERATPADAAAAIATEDAKLFLGLYEACFPTTDDRTTEHDGQHPMSQLKREMMIQILEDLGDQLLDTQAVDPTHMGYLRRIIMQWTAGDGS